MMRLSVSQLATDKYATNLLSATLARKQEDDLSAVEKLRIVLGNVKT